MYRISMTFSIVFCTVILFSPSDTWSTTFQMKNGQKIEGEYQGGSSTEVRIKVGSQTLKFKTGEIASIIFDESSAIQNEFAVAAKNVIRTLKGLAAVTEAGVTYKDYTPRVSDANIKVNEFLEEYKDAPIPEFSQHIIDAMGYYVAAATVWSAKITESYSGVSRDPYVKKCKALSDYFEITKNQMKQDFSSLPIPLEITSDTEVGIYGNGMPYLWKCANDEISQAQALFKK